MQAVYEGVCFSQHVHLERIRALSGPGKTLRLTGGPTRSKVWMQMVADISEQPLEVMDVKESGCLGGAIAAAVGSGLYASFAEAMAAMCPAGTMVRAGSPAPRRATAPSTPHTGNSPSIWTSCRCGHERAPAGGGGGSRQTIR